MRKTKTEHKRVARLHPNKLYYSGFPYTMVATAFCRQSNDYSLSRYNKRSQKNVILGGYENNETKFYQLNLDKTKNGKKCLSYYKFKNEYKKEKANLRKIGWNDAQGVDSYFLENNRYIAALNKEMKEYNIYDISNDDWMLNENIPINARMDLGARSLLVCNKLFVLSYRRNIYILSICNDICFPILIKKYEIKDNTKDYRRHGMCLFECNELKDGKSINFQILLFGEWRIHEHFVGSFLELQVELELNYENISHSKLKISEKRVENVKCVNFDVANKYCNFGFECFLDSKNEPIIIIIGGRNGNYNDKTIAYSLFEYNVIRNELFLFEKVKFLLIKKSCYIFFVFVL